MEKREEIRDQIEYEHICNSLNREQIDEFVEIMLEVALTKSPTIKIGRDAEYPTAFVQQRFAKITCSHIEKVLDGIHENTTRVWNTKAYLMCGAVQCTVLSGQPLHDAGQSRPLRRRLIRAAFFCTPAWGERSFA